MSRRPLSRAQLAFESLLERDDDGADPVPLPPRGQRGSRKKNERGGGGGGREVVVLDETELARRRNSDARASANPSTLSFSASSSAFEELRARFPGAPQDLVRDVLGGSSGGVEAAAEALRSLGLGGGRQEEAADEKEKGETSEPSPPPPPPAPPAPPAPPVPPLVPRMPAMLTEGLWGGLPPDMQRLIYERLSSRDAARAALACREFAARARAARARPSTVEVAPRASLRVIEGQVAAFHGARSVSLAKWRVHLEAFETKNAAEAAAEAASAAAQQGRHWQRREFARPPAASASPTPRLQVADPERVLESIEGALGAVARGAARRAALVASSAKGSSKGGGGGGGGGGRENETETVAEGAASSPFYLPTLDDAAARSEAARVEELSLPRLSHGGDCALGPVHCERLARSIHEVFPELRSVRFEDLGRGAGPSGICRGLCAQFAPRDDPSDDDGGDKDDGGDDDADVLPPSAALHSIAITGAPDLDDEAVRTLLESWIGAAAAAPKASGQQPRSSFDFSRCPALTSAAFSWPRAPPDKRPIAWSMRSITLDGCKNLERFELNGTFPNLQRLSLRNCPRLAEIAVVPLSAPPAGGGRRRVDHRLAELQCSGCPALRSIGGRAGATLPSLGKMVAAGCPSLAELPGSGPAPALAEANFFGCRSLPSSALEAFLGTADERLPALHPAGQVLLPPDVFPSPGGGAAGLLRSLTVNGCVSLSRLRVASAALEALDASGCRSCTEVDLSRCSSRRLRSLRLDGCRQLARLSLPAEHAATDGSGGSVCGGRVGVAFLDPAATSAAGVAAEEVVALVAAATAKRGKKRS